MCGIPLGTSNSNRYSNEITQNFFRQKRKIIKQLLELHILRRLRACNIRIGCRWSNIEHRNNALLIHYHVNVIFRRMKSASLYSATSTQKQRARSIFLDVGSAYAAAAASYAVAAPDYY